MADTVGNTKSGKKLQHTLVNTVAEAKKLNTWRNNGQYVDRKTVETVAYTLGKRKGETLRYRLGHNEDVALLDTLHKSQA